MPTMRSLLAVAAVTSALMFMCSNIARAEEHVITRCNDSLIMEAQRCVAKLTMPETDSAVCAYLERGIDCFPSVCCSNKKYNQGVLPVIEEARKSGCDGVVVCGQAQSTSASQAVFMPVLFLILLLT